MIAEGAEKVDRKKIYSWDRVNQDRQKKVLHTVPPELMKFIFRRSSNSYWWKGDLINTYVYPWLIASVVQWNLHRHFTTAQQVLWWTSITGYPQLELALVASQKFSGSPWSCHHYASSTCQRKGQHHLTSWDQQGIEGAVFVFQPPRFF